MDVNIYIWRHLKYLNSSSILERGPWEMLQYAGAIDTTVITRLCKSTQNGAMATWQTGIGFPYVIITQ